jgi:hypothetical protein
MDDDFGGDANLVNKDHWSNKGIGRVSPLKKPETPADMAAAFLAGGVSRVYICNGCVFVCSSLRVWRAMYIVYMYAQDCEIMLIFPWCFGRGWVSCICVCVCARVCVCVCVSACVSLYVCMYVPVVHICTHAYIHTYIHT